MADKAKKGSARTEDVRHVVVGKDRTTAECISAIAQIADDAPDGSAVVISTADFKRLTS